MALVSSPEEQGQMDGATKRGRAGQGPDITVVLARTTVVRCRAPCALSLSLRRKKKACLIDSKNASYCVQ